MQQFNREAYSLLVDNGYKHLAMERIPSIDDEINEHILLYPFKDENAVINFMHEKKIDTVNRLYIEDSAEISDGVSGLSAFVIIPV